MNTELTYIYGSNAVGKTTLLEAMYYFALLRSPKTRKDEELRKHGTSEFRIQAQCFFDDEEHQFDILYQKGKKRIFLDGKEEKKIRTLIGKLNVLVFSPETLDLVKGEPSIRRNFLNTELSKQSPYFIEQLLRSQKILKQRNALLKQQKYTKEEEEVLDILTEHYIQALVPLYNERLQFIKEIEKEAAKLYYTISGGKEHLKITYTFGGYEEHDVLKQYTYEYLQEKAKELKEREHRYGTTLFGIHRDDIIFYLDEHKAKHYASQGQQRTIAIATILSQIEIIYKKRKEYPIVLLDDVLSELDAERRENMIRVLEQKTQLCITNTHPLELHEHVSKTQLHLTHEKIFEIEESYKTEYEQQEDRIDQILLNI